MVSNATYPLPPNPAPLRGTLLDAADVAEGIQFFGAPATETEPVFDSYNCLKFQHAAEFCAPNTKDMEQSPAWQSAFRFAVYGGLHCKTVGLDEAHMLSETERVFNSGESTAVEQAFMATRFAAGPDTDPGAGTSLAWPAPVDVHSAASVKPVVAVGLLEEYAAANYVGIPTIHMPRSISALLWSNGLLEWDGKILRTKMGTKVAAGAGYAYPNTSPASAAAATDERWLYVTGEVLVRKSKAEIRQIMAMSTNEVYVLAERAYIGAVDCFTAAVRAQVTT